MCNSCLGHRECAYIPCPKWARIYRLVTESGSKAIPTRCLPMCFSCQLFALQDDMRVMGIKACFVLSLMIAFASYSKRLRWAPLKSQRLVMDVVN